MQKILRKPILSVEMGGKGIESHVMCRNVRRTLENFGKVFYVTGDDDKGKMTRGDDDKERQWRGRMTATRDRDNEDKLEGGQQGLDAS